MQLGIEERDLPLRLVLASAFAHSDRIPRNIFFLYYGLLAP